MSDEQVPDVEEIKARLKEDIFVEDESDGQEEPENLKQANNDDLGGVDDALRNLGMEFARTVQTAWNSEQRLEIEQEIRQGVKHFAQELENAFREAKESPAGQKARAETSDFKSQVEQREFAQKARTGIVQGLHWLSEELGKLADQFAPDNDKKDDQPPSPSE